MDVIKYNNKESIIQEIKQLGKAIHEQRKELLVPFRTIVPNNDIVDVIHHDIKYVVNDDSKIIFVGHDNKPIDFETLNTVLLTEVLFSLGIDVDKLKHLHGMWNFHTRPIIVDMMRFTTKEGKTTIGVDGMYITRNKDKIFLFNKKDNIPIENIPFFLLAAVFRASLQDNNDYNNIKELSYFR